MSKVCAVLLFLALVGIAHSSSDPLARIRDKVASHFHRRETIEKRQTCTLPTDYPTECVTASTNLANLLAMNIEDVNLDDLNDALNEACATQCIQPEIEYYECLGQQDLADLVDNAYCGQSSGRNCLVLVIEGAESGDVEPISCTSGGDCSSSCQSSLQGTVDYLGCCAASLYNNTLSPFSALIPPADFSACDVSLGAMCAGASGAEVVAEVGLGLLTIFAVVATLINAVL